MRGFSVFEVKVIMRIRFTGNCEAMDLVAPRRAGMRLRGDDKSAMNLEGFAI
jgi:hypothetical protein